MEAQMQGNIILLRGPSGIGKSTIAMLLRERCIPAIRLDFDSLRYLTTPRFISVKHQQLAELGALDMLIRYARAGFNVVCDSVFQDENILYQAVEKIAHYRIPIQIFSLHAECDELLQRSRDQDHFSRMQEERVISPHENCNWKTGKVVETSGRLPEEIVDVIFNFIREAKHDSCFQKTSTRLIFIRHGQAESNKHSYPQHNDMPLSLKGLAQAKNIALEFQNIQVSQVISSPFPRALQTAHEISRVTGTNVVEDDRWKERTFVSLYGLSWQQIIEKIGQKKANCIRTNADKVELEGEESFINAQKRVVEAFNALDFSDGGSKVVVSHGGPHSWLCSYFLQVPPQLHRKFYIGKAHISSFLLDKDKHLIRIDKLNGKNPVVW